jgi:N-formylglutamate amidohydrolase
MTKHLCQGPKCHTYDTQSRIRGTKGNKVLRTRFARFNLDVNREWIDKWEYFFCDERCMNNWLDVHMTQLISFVGLKTKPQESPVDIVETVHQNWQGVNYTRTTIKLLSEQSDNDTVTA